MSNKKRNADKKPLMYIVQPDYAETTRSSMQEIVIKRKLPTNPLRQKLRKSRLTMRSSRRKPWHRMSCKKTKSLQPNQ